jgi:hypothetical protein
VAAIDAALVDIDLDHEAAPRLVRGYAIEEELGSGAFGTVFQVRPNEGRRAVSRCS